jgi:hypothetical protein
MFLKNLLYTPDCCGCPLQESKLLPSKKKAFRAQPIILIASLALNIPIPFIKIAMFPKEVDVLLPVINTRNLYFIKIKT